MLYKMILLFTLFPLIELYLLIVLGTRIGAGYTVLIVAVTGVLGAALTRSQGLGILQRIKRESEYGNIPGDEILQGLLILIGGALLLTPGLISDVAGFVLVLPVTRIMLVNWLKNRGIQYLQVRGYWGS